MTDIREMARLQEQANKIQAEMVGVIKKYNEVTSRHYKLTAFLTVVIIILTACMLCVQFF